MQPSPETYEVYDDIMLMGDGKVGDVYEQCERV